MNRPRGDELDVKPHRLVHRLNLVGNVVIYIFLGQKVKKSTVAIGGHFEKRDELKLPNGDTSTPSGFFISRVSRQQYSAIKKKLLY